MFPKHQECMRSSALGSHPGAITCPFPARSARAPFPMAFGYLFLLLWDHPPWVCPSAWAQPTHRGQGQFHPDCSEQKRLGGKGEDSVLCGWRDTVGPGSLWPWARKAMGTSLPQPPSALSLTLHHRLLTRPNLNRFSRKRRPRHSLQETAPPALLHPLKLILSPLDTN